MRYKPTDAMERFASQVASSLDVDFEKPRLQVCPNTKCDGSIFDGMTVCLDCGCTLMYGSRETGVTDDEAEAQKVSTTPGASAAESPSAGGAAAEGRKPQTVRVAEKTVKYGPVQHVKSSDAMLRDSIKNVLRHRRKWDQEYRTMGPQGYVRDVGIRNLVPEGWTPQSADDRSGLVFVLSAGQQVNKECADYIESLNLTPGHGALPDDRKEERGKAGAAPPRRR